MFATLILINLVFQVLLGYFIFSTAYLVVFTLAGKFAQKKETSGSMTPVTRFAVIIPSYKCEDVALLTTITTLRQKYPRKLFRVFVIADGFSAETIEKINSLQAIALPVQFENSTKSKALKAIIPFLDRFDYAVVLDVDNMMEPDALRKFDQVIQRGGVVYQAHRTARNLSAPLTLLDAISEEINNTIFRRGQQALGLVPALIGSGMALPVRVFTSLISRINAVGGFDKELEFLLLQENIPVLYLDDLLIYDEKVSQPKVFQDQRKRWLSAQFVYMARYAAKGLGALWKGDFLFFMKFLQTLLLPRVVQLALLLGCSLTGFFYWEIFGTLNHAEAFSALFILHLGMLVLACPRQLLKRVGWDTIITLPKTMLLYLRILFKLKGANREFIHTPHTISR